MIADTRTYESDVVLRDGSTVRLRRLRAEDGPALAELYRRLSPESLYFRFFAARRPSEAGGEGRIDRADFALVAEWGTRIGAVAGWARHPQARERAEVSFTIADALQGRGLGTKLLERLAEIARGEGITTFEAFALLDNHRMLQVFLDSGYEVQQRIEGGLVQVTLSLVETPAFREKAASRARQAAAASLEPIFSPRVVAVVGANRRPGQIGSEIFRNLLACGFTGQVVPVNPSAAEVEGVAAYPTVSSIPGPVDLAVVAVPAAAVLQVVDDCLAKPVRGLVVISAGFGETGAEGARLEADLLERVRRAGIRLIGPNCMGVINTDPAVQLNATFSPVFPPAGRVAFSTQSGALGLAILDYVRSLNLGISTFVSVGNKADVSGNDLIQYWADDPATDVILLYLESFGNPRKFSEIARRVARDKPIVAVKAGRSVVGARAASSHTGALAASDAVVDALFRQAGVIRTTRLEELFDVAALLAQQPLPAGNRVGILTNAGGPGILAADACDAHGLVVPPLGDATVAGLRALLPAAASVANPVDMLASAPAEHYRRAIPLMLADERVDSLIVIYIPPLVTEPAEVAAAVVGGAGLGPHKPVLATFMSTQGASTALAPIPSYLFPESAAAALGRVARYAAWKQKPSGPPAAFGDIEPHAVRTLMGPALARGGGWLTPAEAASLLSAAGLAVAASRVVASVDEAVAAAREIGFPVALKGIGPGLLHKTERAALRLGLAGEDAVRAAAGDLTRRLGGELTGLLVQRMVPGGIEMIVGATEDPVFGPVVLCGTGGTMVELFRDVSFRLHPLTGGDAAEMLDEIQGAALLRGFRGAPPADEAALREAVLRVSALLEVCPEIQEMDLNPITVLREGACVLDARIKVGHRRPPAPTRRIAY